MKPEYSVIKKMFYILAVISLLLKKTKWNSNKCANSIILASIINRETIIYIYIYIYIYISSG